ncbi:hypothetical protein QNJ95_44145 [Bradyrhizobium elkanii]|uniref:hypothetical protein n=1 Tax=Bradyrhizobium elkanii TaxID=29448 RepID=UPI00271210E1|nr:hypothetical protein [Bradyrhizobium elkanii]WLA39750.1 hypothetical protein QNJ95_44145 [Bradyrhizobium elkanii]
MPNSQQGGKPNYKDVLDITRCELIYRRKKQWDIFVWVVTILVSVISGIVVLTSKGEIKPDLVSRFAMAFALVFLTRYAIVWINENIEAEKHANEVIRKLLRDHNVEVDAIRRPSEFRFGYDRVLMLIGCAAVLSILLVSIVPGWLELVP